MKFRIYLFSFFPVLLFTLFSLAYFRDMPVRIQAPADSDSSEQVNPTKSFDPSVNTMYGYDYSTQQVLHIP